MTIEALVDAPPLAELLFVPYRSLVVVAGIPGAGKSTLVRRWADEEQPDVRYLDPETIRVRWERVLGGRPLYAVWRPLVYVEHYVRLLFALAGRKVVVVQDTATRRPVRRALAGLAALTRRPACLVWIDVTLAESLDGQRRRGRRLRSRSVLRHWRRWSSVRTRDREPGYVQVLAVDRRAAADLELVPWAVDNQPANTT